MIYIVLITFLLLLALFSNKRNDNAFFYLGFFCVFVILAFRDYKIGANDTYNYVRYFVGKQNYYSEDSRDLESGFLFYNSIVKFVTSTGYGYLFINTLVSMSSIFLMIKLYSEKKTLSLLYFFLPIGAIYVVYFIALRQIIGMSFFLFGMMFYLKNVKYKHVLFLLFSLIGYLFHTSIVLMIVFFTLLNHIKISKKTYVIVIFVSFIVGLIGLLDNLVFLMSFFNLLDPIIGRLAGYAESELILKKFSLVSVTTSVMGILLCLGASDKKFNSIFVKMFLVGIVIQNVFFKFIEVYRLAALFTIFGMVSCTYIDFNKIRIPKLWKSALKIIFIVIIVYSYYKIINDFVVYNVADDPRKLVPYNFIFETGRDY